MWVWELHTENDTWTFCISVVLFQNYVILVVSCSIKLRTIIFFLHISEGHITSQKCCMELLWKFWKCLSVTEFQFEKWKRFITGERQLLKNSQYKPHNNLLVFSVYLKRCMGKKLWIYFDQFLSHGRLLGCTTFSWQEMC